MNRTTPTPGRFASARLPLIALLAAACGGGGPPAGPGPGPGAGPEPPAPAPTRLEPLGSETRAGDTFQALGLTGENKPNGIVERYRRGVPDGTPGYVADRVDGLALWLADRVEDGWLALYRGETADWRQAAAYRVRLYGGDGRVAWELDPAGFFSRDDLVEIQDIRYRDGALFFNEACATYSREAGGRCSALLRVDPGAGRLVWRSRDRVSNDIFLPHGRTVISGYGFTAEPDSVFLLDAATGAVLDARPLDTAHSYLEVHGDTLHVVTRQRHHRFRLR